MIVFENVEDFNLEHIFTCGQCFRWNRNPSGSYYGIVGESSTEVRFADGVLYIDDNEEKKEFWKTYFDLDRDYGRIKEYLSKDPVMKEAIPYGSGIRILRQDPWEMIVSFIISQNNNIPRIKGCIENLSMHFGEKTEDGKNAFPGCDRLASMEEEDLVPVKLGYRARYIVNTARKIADMGGKAFLAGMKERPDQEIREFLLSLPGVGPKVADCILLFGFGRHEAFPVDVWVKRLMNRLYGFSESDVRGMKAFAADTFGSYGGFAQQYLFHYIRQLDG